MIARSVILNTKHVMFEIQSLDSLQQGEREVFYFSEYSKYIYVSREMKISANCDLRQHVISFHTFRV